MFNMARLGASDGSDAGRARAQERGRADAPAPAGSPEPRGVHGRGGLPRPGPEPAAHFAPPAAADRGRVPGPLPRAAMRLLPRAGRRVRDLEWSRQLLRCVDPDDPVLRRDRERAAEVVGDASSAAAGELAGAAPADRARTRAGGRLLRRGARSRARVGELLDIGTGPGCMLEILGPRAEHAVGIDMSAPALRLARTRVHGAGWRTANFAAATCTACRLRTAASTR